LAKWNVGTFAECTKPGLSKSKLTLKTGVTVDPVLVVVESQCREQLKASANVLLKYAVGAGAVKPLQLFDTTDTDEPVSRAVYEEEMEVMADDILSNKKTRSQTVDRIACKVTFFLVNKLIVPFIRSKRLCLFHFPTLTSSSLFQTFIGQKCFSSEKEESGRIQKHDSEPRQRFAARLSNVEQLSLQTAVNCRHHVEQPCQRWTARLSSVEQPSLETAGAGAHHVEQPGQRWTARLSSVEQQSLETAVAGAHHVEYREHEGPQSPRRLLRRRLVHTCCS
jgi:hypothetical protein